MVTSSKPFTSLPALLALLTVCMVSVYALKLQARLAIEIPKVNLPMASVMILPGHVKDATSSILCGQSGQSSTQGNGKELIDMENTFLGEEEGKTGHGSSEIPMILEDCEDCEDFNCDLEVQGESSREHRVIGSQHVESYKNQRRVEHCLKPGKKKVKCAGLKGKKGRKEETILGTVSIMNNDC